MENTDGLRKKSLVKKSLMFGALGFCSLIIFYFLILTVANSFEHAVYQFWSMWYWIVILSLGFGAQAGLYVHTKGFSKIYATDGSTGGAMAVSGGASTVSMVACCAHHVTDFLPLLGLSFAAVFLVKYQLLFIVFGVISNLFGITMMLRTIQKHNLFDDGGAISKIMKVDMSNMLKVVAGAGTTVIFVMYIMLI